MRSTGGRPTPVWNPAPEVVDRLRRSTTQVWAAPGVTDLGVGQPDLSLLPAELLQSAFAHEPLAARSPLQYGGPLGDGLFRLALGEFLTGAYGVETDPEAIFVTNGNSQAIDLVCTVFTTPGDVVFVEEPTYFLALDIFRRHGLQVIGIPVDDDGLSIEALEVALVEHRPALVYTIPAYQNPTGVTLSHERRARLVELAQVHEFLIAADEVYQLLSFDGGWVAPMAAWIDSGVVLSLGTFSKILAPGLRLGWIQAAPPLLEKLCDAPVVVSGAGLNPFTSAIVRVLLEEGLLSPHVEYLRGTLADRAATMSAGIAAHLPASVEWTPPTGGYFHWLRFPGESDTFRWWHTATEHKTGFRAGSLFSTTGGCKEFIRLSFAFYPGDQIATAIEALGSVVRT